MLLGGYSELRLWLNDLFLRGVWGSTLVLWGVAGGERLLTGSTLSAQTKPQNGQELLVMFVILNIMGCFGLEILLRHLIFWATKMGI